MLIFDLSRKKLRYWDHYGVCIVAVVFVRGLRAKTSTWSISDKRLHQKVVLLLVLMMKKKMFKELVYRLAEQTHVCEIKQKTMHEVFCFIFILRLKAV